MSGGPIFDGDPASGVAAEVMFGEQSVGHVNGALRVARKGKVLYDSGVVATGAVIDSPAIDLTAVESIYIVAINSDGAATRALTMDTLLDDGVTTIDAGLALNTVAAASTVRGAMGLAAGALGTPALQFSTQMALPSKIKLHLAAAGASNGRLIVFGR